jgi:hypothetical protein
MTTLLSPAAQAVSNAAKSSLDWEAGYLPNAVAAAALRAAADQLREAYANEEYVDSADDWLDGVAAEVEGH